MNDIDNIKVTYKVITPLFCGGANLGEGGAAELRQTSFKGVLRWWWRALTWQRYHSLETIQKVENKIFGSADAGNGQSRVLMRLVPASLPKPLLPGDVMRDNLNTREPVGARYLGYGVINAYASKKSNLKAGQLLRSCFPAPFKIEIKLRCRDLVSDELNSLIQALQAVGLLGGFGAKSRKGYGSLVLQSLTHNGVELWQQPRNPEELGKKINSLYFGRDKEDSLPPYTAFSSQSRHILLAVNRRISAMTLLDMVGREMMYYRSWGYRGRVINSESEKNFKYDHDLMYKKPQERRTHPLRIVFGLPHNYGKEAEKQVTPAHRDLDRRASPLLIHIHECNSGPVAVLSFLPAEFLPSKNSGINVGGQVVPLAPYDQLWNPITDLLERFLGRSQKPRREQFSHVLEVGCNE